VGNATDSAAGCDLGSTWTALLESVGRASPFVRSYLIKASPVALGQKTFVIGFEPRFAEYLPLVDVPRNHALIKTKLKELGLEVDQIKFQRVDEAGPVPMTKEPPAETQGRSKPGKLSPADFKNDPLIQQALETFKGTIAEVRGG